MDYGSCQQKKNIQNQRVWKDLFQSTVLVGEEGKQMVAVIRIHHPVLVILPVKQM
jgi:hypothetical protein